jgi:hypothetical protein
MNIQETGVRGYLKWLQRDQPGLYRLAAPVIAQRVPEAFSDREQSMAMGALMGFADDTASGTTTFFGDSATPFDSASVEPAATDVADAANSGAASSGIVGTIKNIISGISQAYLAKSQVDTLNQVNQIQLQRAAAGLPPLNTSTLQLGVPQVNVGLSKGTLTGGGVALAVVAGLGLLWFFGSKGRGPAQSV